MNNAVIELTDIKYSINATRGDSLVVGVQGDSMVALGSDSPVPVGFTPVCLLLDHSDVEWVRRHIRVLFSHVLSYTDGTVDYPDDSRIHKD